MRVPNKLPYASEGDEQQGSQTEIGRFGSSDSGGNVRPEAVPSAAVTVPSRSCQNHVPQRPFLERRYTIEHLEKKIARADYVKYIILQYRFCNLHWPKIWIQYLNSQLYAEIGIFALSHSILNK